MLRKLLPLIALLLLSQLAFTQQTNKPSDGTSSAQDTVFVIRTIFLVRHAERADEPRQDPPLTEKGVARSEALARLLSTADIKAIYTSQFARTKLTAEPLAKQVGVPITAISLKSSPSNPRAIAEESTKETVDKILSNVGGGSVLLVGHSNSIPDVIKMLGGDAPTIDEKKFDDLFVVTVYANHRAKVTHLKYGTE